MRIRHRRKLAAAALISSILVITGKGQSPDAPAPAAIADLASDPKKDTLENPAPAASAAGAGHLAAIVSEPWAKTWQKATVHDVKLVEPKENPAFATGLPAVWHARIEGPDGKSGYLMWDTGESGKLVEFALDDSLTPGSANARAIAGVPQLQQFPMQKEDGSLIASGCVPTSAASLLGFWIAGDYPTWAGSAGGDPAALTKRLRSRLSMKSVPDVDGFTENGMALAGAQTPALAKAIQADAAEHKIPVTAQFERFDFQELKAEIDAGRPVLLTCLVRVPHKPHLSWGHAIAGVGWAKLNGEDYAGVLDNFFPVKHPETIRWIRSDAFHGLITVKPTSEK